MDNKKSIENIISLEAKTTGRSFAFIVDKTKLGQFWFVIHFIYYQIDPVLKCDYLLEILSVEEGKIELEKELKYSELKDLVEFLANKKINPNYYRAMH